MYVVIHFMLCYVILHNIRRALKKKIDSKIDWGYEMVIYGKANTDK